MFFRCFREGRITNYSIIITIRSDGDRSANPPCPVTICWTNHKTRSLYFPFILRFRSMALLYVVGSNTTTDRPVTIKPYELKPRPIIKFNVRITNDIAHCPAAARNNVFGGEGRGGCGPNPNMKHKYLVTSPAPRSMTLGP